MNLLRKPFRWTYSNAVIYLIIINVIVYVFQTFGRGITFQVADLRIGINNLLAMNPVLVLRYNMYWQFVTYMFAHGGFTHILFNMLALFIFGRQFEYRIGSKEFVLYYMVSGIAAGILSFVLFVFTGGTYISLLGASGAIFAVQLAYAAFFPDSVIYIWGILPLRAPVMVLVFTAIELFSGLSGFNSGTAHFTHLFGFLSGFLFFIIRWGQNPFRLMFGRRW
jgi:membrane associated rhomboid family serine protease